ncbi:ABC transporter ATP-binding protein [uncultured Psychroserpens sp.]|uniref:ABC transporter ATP-binding protein n=1 Tax=uncultured Psychroserpens sp. TaxID=255436 RepID=UPI00260F78B8|nr:ABC transporter ATP-binding protein [uncultured Psychroserpens sp.]
MSVILKASNISKQYRLGLIGTGTLSHDLNRWWHKLRGKEDPYLRVGDSNDRSTKAESDYVWALRDVDFEVEKGEVLGIIGKNGAGKSTLLKILSRVTTPTIGEIKTRGRIASLLEVGTGFHPELTGRENIFLNGAILGMNKSEISNKLDEIVEFSGCQRYVDTPVKRYSSGMRVRLAFAVAAFLEPDILVIDEVLAVGDAEFQKKAVGKMQDISQGDGRTVLFVSHNMAAVKRLCSRTIVLEHGEIVYNGDTDEAINKYLSIGEEDHDVMHYVSKDENTHVKDIEVLSENKTFLTGSTLSFKINMNSKPKGDFNILIGIYNKKDEKVMHLSSKDFMNSLEMNAKGEIVCHLDKNPLIQGSYYTNIVLQYNKDEHEKHNECLRFSVVNGDFFNTNKLPRLEKINVFVDHSWSSN